MQAASPRCVVDLACQSLSGRIHDAFRESKTTLESPLQCPALRCSRNPPWPRWLSSVQVMLAVAGTLGACVITLNLFSPLLTVSNSQSRGRTVVTMLGRLIP